MSTISQHTIAVAQVRETLPRTPVVYIASVGDPTVYHQDGVVLPVGRELAAKYIAKKTHRLATIEEIRTYDEAERRAKADAENNKPQPITAETIAMIARAANSGNSGNERQGRGKGDQSSGPDSPAANKL